MDKRRREETIEQGKDFHTKVYFVCGLCVGYVGVMGGYGGLLEVIHACLV